MINKNKDIKLAIIGLGYVGLPLALEFAKKKEVIGYDINKKRIKELNIGYDQNLEFNKKELQRSKKLKFTTKEKDLKFVNCFIISVPTPIDKFKKPDLNPLLKASKMVGGIIKKGDIPAAVNLCKAWIKKTPKVTKTDLFNLETMQSNTLKIYRTVLKNR